MLMMQYNKKLTHVQVMAMCDFKRLPSSQFRGIKATILQIMQKFTILCKISAKNYATTYLYVYEHLNVVFSRLLSTITLYQWILMVYILLILSLFTLMIIYIYIYIYKTETSAGTTIFHVSTIFKK